jgi:hypothetical protein
MELVNVRGIKAERWAKEDDIIRPYLVSAQPTRLEGLDSGLELTCEDGVGGVKGQIAKVYGVPEVNSFYSALLDERTHRVRGS